MLKLLHPVLIVPEGPSASTHEPSLKKEERRAQGGRARREELRPAPGAARRALSSARDFVWANVCAPFQRCSRKHCCAAPSPSDHVLPPTRLPYRKEVPLSPSSNPPSTSKSRAVQGDMSSVSPHPCRHLSGALWLSVPTLPQDRVTKGISRCHPDTWCETNGAVSADGPLSLNTNSSGKTCRIRRCRH